MVKLVIWGVRKVGLTTKQFYEGNHIVHGELVRDGPRDFKETILRYTQSYAFDAQYGAGDAQEFDSVAELWFESTDMLTVNFAHPYYQNTVMPDGANFADEAANVVHLADEEVVGKPPLRGQGLKVVQSLSAVDGTDLDAFDDLWQSAHEHAAPELGRLLLGYTRNRPPRGLPPMNGAPPAGYSGIWLDGRQDIDAFRAYDARFMEIAAKSGLVDRARCFYMLCEERRVVDTFLD